VDEEVVVGLDGHAACGVVADEDVGDAARFDGVERSDVAGLGDDFAAARNYAFSLASCDYIFSADADEILDERNNQALKDLNRTLDLLDDDDDVQYVYTNLDE